MEYDKDLLQIRPSEMVVVKLLKGVIPSSSILLFVISKISKRFSGDLSKSPKKISTQTVPKSETST